MFMSMYLSAMDQYLPYVCLSIGRCRFEIFLVGVGKNIELFGSKGNISSK